MSLALQRYGRGIADGFHGVIHRQATDCGDLVSALEGEEETERRGLSRTDGIEAGEQAEASTHGLRYGC